MGKTVGTKRVPTGKVKERWPGSDVKFLRSPLRGGKDGVTFERNELRCRVRAPLGLRFVAAFEGSHYLCITYLKAEVNMKTEEEEEEVSTSIRKRRWM